jgi:hypothetical protein
MTATLPAEILQSYRADTFRTRPGTRLHSAEEAVTFVNERGLVFFWPNKQIDLPSLWVAAAGDRPVPDEHDDPGHITWGWKDGMLGKKQWYYARAIHRRNAMISLKLMPYFYALSPNYGDPEHDYLEQYEQGQLTQEARLIYQALLIHGTLDTLALRKESRMSSPSSDTRFNRALDDLQMQFKILPVGISQAGAWRYAFIYEISAYHFPEIQEQARTITEPQARRAIMEACLQSSGVLRQKDFKTIFHWLPQDIEKDIQALASDGKVIVDVEVPGKPDLYIATNLLFKNS